MSRINILDKKTANAIKAGEVIERPVSVVKELFDNAVDSGASRITVEYKNGGITMIRVTDNGIGMDRDDAQKAFLIHATSKIKKIEDLMSLSTMGFRGEALPSIAAVSRVSILTKQEDSDIGTLVEYDDGAQVRCEDASTDNGTVVTVNDLFYNTPARYKFLKKDATEGMYIANLVEKLAIVNPHITVKLIKDGQVILATPGNGSMLDTIYAVHGKDIASALIPVNYTHENIKVTGFTARPDLTRGNRALELVYVNDRSIKSSTATAAIEEAYRNSVMKNKYPICFLTVYADPAEVDCNIHPQKIEVKFSNDSNLFRAIYHAITNALESIKPQKQMLAQDDLLEEFSPDKPKADPIDYIMNRPTDNGDKKEVFTHSVSSGMRPLENVSKPSQLEIRASNNILNILSGIDSIEENRSEPAQESSSMEYVAPEPSVQLVEPVIAPTEEFTKKRNSDIEILMNSKIVGTLFATYIVLQSDDAVYLVDQHAAHERVLYEDFLAKAKSGSNENYIQQLLVPDIVTLSSSDYVFVMDNKDELAKYGFDVEAMGDREVAIRSIPVMGSVNAKPSKIFTDLLTELKKELPTGNDKWYLSIATAACKAAIKGHDLITTEEVRALLESLSYLEDPYHCPHGRPTFVKLTNDDLEKMFKRIV